MVRKFDLLSAALYARVRRSGRVLVVVDTLLSSISWTLLMYASTQAFEQLPKWAGLLDGVIAFIVVILSAVIERSYHWLISADVTQLAHTLATYLVPVLFILLFIFQHQLIWNTLLPGLAWRVYVVLLVLPPSLAAIRSRTSAD
jgi:hypothetical protein